MIVLIDSKPIPSSIMASSAQNNDVDNDWICTQVRGDHLEYEWTIKNFKSLPQKNGEYISSPVFPPNNANEQWRMKLYPQNRKTEDREWISVYLFPVLDKMVGIEIKYEISIIKSKQVVKELRTSYKFQLIDGYGFPKFIERSELLTQDDSDDAITVCCKIDVLGTYFSSSSHLTSPKEVISFESRGPQLPNDFKALYKDPKFTDFTIVVGNEKIPTHKSILSSRSSVFAAMFEHKGMDENVKNEVKIDNITPDVVKGLLEYIYTNNVIKIENLARRLLAAAEQYALEGLKHLCEESLYKTMDENSAAEIFAIADLYQADLLKKYAKRYIVDHRREVLQSEAFKMTGMPLCLAKELIFAFALPESENNENQPTS